ncbi:HdeD family acid-resistance protein [Mesorhizobium sp.]|uniref:HdeD family acid-resistance protein n=2 Tax=Mesorhizobium sp. TaxID=1871066 RepID=UPI000FE68D70|nr:HdeD family acid-resistance protein [Mesorhizobium sp.]RWC58440.1 MAG: HdeD family acid-resistance protein [Mesorhizobium sp.]RWC64925.1 MAG: HdeD family acid-resistance protein [Mesorhizobium sp.]
MSNIAADHSLGGSLKMLHRKWGWFVALGVGLLIGGIIAGLNLYVATLVSVFYIAASMLAGGVMQVFHAFTTHGWGNRIVYLLAGLLYALASAIALFNPLLSAFSISLVVGVLLIATGAVRIVTGIQASRQHGWGWMVATGLVTMIVGGVVVAAWPAIGLSLLGAILTFDLLFQGYGFIAFGLSMRRRAG